MNMPRTQKRLVKNVWTQVIDAESLSGTCLVSEPDQEKANKDERFRTYLSRSPQCLILILSLIGLSLPWWKRRLEDLGALVRQVSVGVAKQYVTSLFLLMAGAQSDCGAWSAFSEITLPSLLDS